MVVPIQLSRNIDICDFPQRGALLMAVTHAQSPIYCISHRYWKYFCARPISWLLTLAGHQPLYWWYKYVGLKIPRGRPSNILCALFQFAPLSVEEWHWYTIPYSSRTCQDYVYMKREYWSTLWKIKHYWIHENKVNENKELSYCKHVQRLES